MRLFPGHENDDNRRVGNEVEGPGSVLEKFADFRSASCVCATTINVDSKTGFITSKDAEEGG